MNARLAPRRSPCIVGIGEALWDVFPEGNYFGGAPGNFAVHVAGLTGSCSLITSLGDDEAGRKARRFLTNRGVSLDHVQTHPSRATGEVRVELDEHAVPSYHFAPEPAWADLLSTPAQLELAATCDAVLFGTLGQSSQNGKRTTREFLTACPAHCLRLFDLNLRRDFWSPELIVSSLSLATGLKCNEEEIRILAEITHLCHLPPAELLQEIIARYDLEFAALTQGAEGSLVVTQEERDWQESPSGTVIDTTGAGDCFIAMLLTGLLARRPLSEVHRQASRVASYLCTQQGAAPELPAEILPKWFI